MQAVCSSINGYISYFPLVVFLSLLLAGFNVPLSEDLLIISSALLAKTDRSLLIPLAAAIYSGVVLSDHIAYWIGSRIRKGLTKNRFFAKVLTKRKLARMHHYLDKYGIFTFIVCRFIPFGVRNTLFIGSGVMQVKYRIFILYDLVAAAISTTTLFLLIYYLGDSIEKPFKVIGGVLFIVLALTVGAILTRLAVRWKRSFVIKHPPRADS